MILNFCLGWRRGHAFEIQRKKALYGHRGHHTGDRAGVHLLSAHDDRPAAQHGPALRGGVHHLCRRHARTGGKRRHPPHGIFLCDAERHQEDHLFLQRQRVGRDHAIQRRRQHGHGPDRDLLQAGSAAGRVGRRRRCARDHEAEPGYAARGHPLRHPRRSGPAGPV